MTVAAHVDPGSAMPAEIAACVAAGLVSAADVDAVVTLVGIARRDVPTLAPDRRAWLAMCLALRAPRDGHTCVFLDAIADWRACSAADVLMAVFGLRRAEPEPFDHAEPGACPRDCDP